jgi:glutaredoxin
MNEDSEGHVVDKAILYTLRGCPTCEKARRGLSQRGVQFEERLVDDNPAWWKEAVALAATVPILVWNDRVEVGWEGEAG